MPLKGLQGLLVRLLWAPALKGLEGLLTKALKKALKGKYHPLKYSKEPEAMPMMARVTRDMGVERYT